jgi:hypothetical protein
LDRNLDALRKQGLGLAAISYDSEAALKDFTVRRNIRFPLLSDLDSKVIREFGLLNESVAKNTLFFGIPYPVTYIVDRKGRIKSKYFEEDYRERQTLAGLLAKDYGVLPAASQAEVQARHVKLRTASSTETVSGGQRILLSVTVDMPKGYHVYAPGTEGYIPISWTLNPSPGWKEHEVIFPKSRVLFLKAIDEKVPVYEGTAVLARDVTIGDERALKPILSQDGTLTIEGTVRYQACSERVCFPPETVPVKWTLKRVAHDSQRVPPALQRKATP